MSKIARADKADPLLFGPPGKGLHFHILAGGPAIFGVEMKIGYEPHHNTLNVFCHAEPGSASRFIL
jgi:hypothetical protein